MITDGQLLSQYCETHSEPAFAELVSRHIDLVYAAALRIVGGDQHLAEDVTQMVFTDLARKAAALPRGIQLAGWLYRHTSFTAANTVRSERRRTAREQKAVAMSASDESSDPSWEQLAARLDGALNRLRRDDREALVLRFLKREDLGAVGAALGISEDAAQKRVARALERLRLILQREGVTTTAAALAAGLASHAVTAAPTGFALSVAAASVSAAAQAGALFNLVQAVVAMKVQVSVITLVLAANVVTPLFMLRQIQSQLRLQDQALLAGAEQLAALRAERDRLANLVTVAENAPALPPKQFSELLHLRGEIGRLRKEAQTPARETSPSSSGEEMFAKLEHEWGGRAAQLKVWLEENPAARIPELHLLSDSEWVNAIYPIRLENEEEWPRAISAVRGAAELKVMQELSEALIKYVRRRQGQVPAKFAELAPYLRWPLSESILERYDLVPAGKLVPVLRADQEWVITQKQAVDPAWDTRFSFGVSGGGMADLRVTNRWSFVP